MARQRWISGARVIQSGATSLRIEPLRSGTGDVGLMQINEKVWRGFYDIQKLRWDIAYNGRAGAASQDTGERWVLAQGKDRFTLQLAVFGNRESARKFIAQQSLSGQVGIYPVRKGKTTQFAVLFGSYAKRATADRAKQRLKHLKPWVRQFGEVRKAGRS